MNIIIICITLPIAIFALWRLLSAKKPVRNLTHCKVCHRCMHGPEAVVKQVSIGTLFNHPGRAMICTDCWDRLLPQQRFDLCKPNSRTLRAFIENDVSKAKDEASWLMELACACDAPTMTDDLMMKSRSQQ